MRDERTEQTEQAGDGMSLSEELERLSRMIERESRRYPPDFERRGMI